MIAVEQQGGGGGNFCKGVVMQRGSCAMNSQGLQRRKYAADPSWSQDAGRPHTREELEHASPGLMLSNGIKTREVFNLIHVVSFRDPRIVGEESQYILQVMAPRVHTQTQVQKTDHSSHWACAAYHDYIGSVVVTCVSQDTMDSLSVHDCDHYAQGGRVVGNVSY